MNKTIFAGLVPAMSALCVFAHAQTPVDTTGIYGERRDSLDATVVVASQPGTFLSKGKDIRTEVITAAGLCKMACCNLSESFENSASVTVGYSDAVTGARQIRLLGQSGVYTQMLDENRPVMRGLSAPWGLNFVPGQWLESIQIAKGSTSVINGVESMTGQINMEHRKPTDETPLRVQASYMNDTKTDLNVISALQLDELKTWSTVILAHVDGNFKAMDHNGDGFMDDPKQLNFAFSNRWLYFGQDGVQVRFGFRAISDDRTGGQMEESGWRSNVLNRSLNGYVKVGVPVSENGDRSFALVTDYTYQTLASNFSIRRFDAGQHSAFANLMYQDLSSENHRLTLGVSGMLDVYDEQYASGLTDAQINPHLTFDRLSSSSVSIAGFDTKSRLGDLGFYGEYSYHNGDKFSAIVGMRGDCYNGYGARFVPRLTFKWSPVESIVLRANGGRGLRYSDPIPDNIGVLSTNKMIVGDFCGHTLEDSWTYGANASWYLPVDSSGKTCLSVDYFHTSFSEQLIYDNSCSVYPADIPCITFYKLSSLSDGLSYTDNVQVDFSSEPVRGLTFTLTGRFTDARQTMLSQSDNVKPMTSRYKAVFNTQYATRLNKWIVDFTASLNGPCRVWDFMRDLDVEYRDGYSSMYPLVYAQVTRRFKGLDIYLGGENLTGFTQPNPIICADAVQSPHFDASCIWGPLMGARIYAGVRMTIWKTN